MAQTIDYDALIDPVGQRHQSLEEIARRRGVARLAEIAQNLETLAELAAQPPQPSPLTITEPAPPAGAPPGDPA